MAPGRSARLLWALGINLALSAGLLFAGRAAHSTGLASDAGHNLTDAVAILTVVLAERLSSRPATDQRSWGFHRASILAALANGLVLVAVTVTIAWMAVERLIHPVPVHGGIMLLAASISMAANIGVVWLLTEGSADLGIRSALIHSMGDALSSAVVAFAGLVALLGSGVAAERVDPVASLIVAGFIVVEAIRVTRESVGVLVEGVPVDIDLLNVRTMLGDLDGVAEVHDLHVWALSSSHRALSAHLLISDDRQLSATAELIAEARSLLNEHFAIDHVTIELETERCAEAPPHA